MIDLVDGRHVEARTEGAPRSRAPGRSEEDRPPRVRVDVVDRLVEHLDRRHGHAVLTGPLGFGLGSAMHTCAEELAARGRQARVVPLHVMTGEQPTPWPTLGGDDVLVLDARHTRQTDVVEEALRQVAASGSQLLLVAALPGTADEGALEALVRARGAGVFVLRPWKQHEIQDFLRLRHFAERDAAQVAARTGGLPWLLRHLRPRAEDDPLAGGPGSPSSDRVSAFVVGLLDSADRCVADTVLALAVGYPVAGRPPLPGAAADDLAGQDELLRSVEASGLLGADGGLPPLVRDCLLEHAPSHWIERARIRLVDDIVAAGEDLAAWAPDLVRQGVTDHRVVAALLTRTRERLASSQEPEALAATADLLRAVLDAGVHVGEVRIELCRVALRQGDLDTATRELDRVLADGGAAPQDLLAVGLEVAQAMDLPHLADTVVRRVHEQDPCAAVDHPGVSLSRYAVGDRAGAEAAIASAHEQGDGATSAATMLVRGVATTITGPPAAALPQLMQAAAAWVPSGVVTDHPSAFVALWGLHAGDLRLVDSTVRSATQDVSMPPVLRSRLVVLGAWSAMASGRLDEADVLIDGLTQVAPRDRLWLCALRAGLARRRDDYAALRAEWDEAREVVLSHPVSLWQLLPLGELGLAAARLRDFDVIRPLWDRASELLVELGEPALWSSPFHWYAVQVALQQDDPGAVAPHAAALVRAARDWPLAVVLSSAGRSWVRVRARDVDPDEVERSARALGRVGLPWEGARLASHGAGAASVRRDRDRLNECAREVLPRVVPAPPGTTARGADATPRGAEAAAAASLQLTDREWQVAELVVAGRTYKQIGEVLYLSPKTVEHHVARMRRRSGVASRAELLELLLAMVGHPDGTV